MSLKNTLLVNIASLFVPKEYKTIVNKIGKKTLSQVIDIIGYSNISEIKGAVQDMDKQKIINIVNTIGEEKLLKVIELIGIKNIVDIALDFVEDKDKSQ